MRRIEPKDFIIRQTETVENKKNKNKTTTTPNIIGQVFLLFSMKKLALTLLNDAKSHCWRAKKKKKGKTKEKPQANLLFNRVRKEKKIEVPKNKTKKKGWK